MPRMWRWIKRIALLALPLAVILGAVGFLYARGVLIASLPVTRGTLAIPGLLAPVEVARDAQGVVTVSASGSQDAFEAEGFVHAQERFAQMDALRRYAAGRLSELFGAAAIELDKKLRPHDFERRADEVLQRLPAHHRAMLAAYARGVNAGLAHLGAPPPEHAILRAPLKPWSERDTLLVQYTMWDTLALNRDFEFMTGTMRQALPQDMVRFLTPDRTRWDAPLLQDPASPAGKPRVPGPDVMNLRDPARPATNPKGERGAHSGARGEAISASFADTPGPITDEAAPVGSNCFAVAGNRTPTGAAILANDMHLALKVPAMWFRVRLAWKDRRLDGLSLPGVPGIIAGSNGSLAWGFTNIEGDFEDWIVVETDPKNPDRYRTPDGGTEAFGRRVEQIDVAGGSAQRLELRVTRWGPVTRTDAQKRPLVSRWIAHDTDQTNLNLLDLFTAGSIEDGVRIAGSWHGPPQNVLLASSTGRIAWVISGAIPLRRGFDGSFPVSWAAPASGGEMPAWIGWLDDKDRPRIIDPPGGALATANQRTMPADRAGGFGSAWANGARAARIGELLHAREKLNEADLLAIQLDTRQSLMDFYKDLALDVCEAGKGDASLAGVASVVRSWSGRADIDQAGFALLHRFRQRLRTETIGPIVKACEKLDPGFRYRWFQDEEPLRTLLEARPMHLLAPKYADWPALFRAALADAVKDLQTTGPKKGLATTWGDLSRAKIEHPLSASLAVVPALKGLLDMPPDPLPGDTNTVRVNAAAFGASERLVVSPGREETGICELPCGQSGHPMSDHYRDMHGAWVRGEPTPLTPGAAVSVLKLEPKAN